MDYFVSLVVLLAMSVSILWLLTTYHDRQSVARMVVVRSQKPAVISKAYFVNPLNPLVCILRMQAYFVN